MLLLVPGPTLPSLDGLAELLDFMLEPVVIDEWDMLEPVVIDEWDLVCLCDFACAASGAPARPAATSTAIAVPVFFMKRTPSVE